MGSKDPLEPRKGSKGDCNEAIEYEAVVDRLVFALREKVDEAVVNGVVVSVSGGVDSTITAFLAVKALEKRRFLIQ
ncbi:hypothetical protein [Thermococcus sp.]